MYVNKKIGTPCWRLHWNKGIIKVGSCPLTNVLPIFWSFSKGRNLQNASSSLVVQQYVPFRVHRSLLCRKIDCRVQLILIKMLIWCVHAFVNMKQVGVLCFYKATFFGRGVLLEALACFDNPDCFHTWEGGKKWTAGTLLLISSANLSSLFLSSSMVSRIAQNPNSDCCKVSSLSWLRMSKFL